MKLLKVLFFSALFASGCGGSAYNTTSGGSISGINNFTVTIPNAPSSFNISGTENPSLTFRRGLTYTFNVNETGHPFYIMSVQGTNTANAFTTGVTGNGANPGTLTFVVPAGAPNTLFYDCSIHGAMTGTITITN
jgi:hypothetical protein